MDSEASVTGSVQALIKLQAIRLQVLVAAEGSARLTEMRSVSLWPGDILASDDECRDDCSLQVLQRQGRKKESQGLGRPWLKHISQVRQIQPVQTTCRLSSAAAWRRFVFAVC